MPDKGVTVQRGFGCDICCDALQGVATLLDLGTPILALAANMAKQFAMAESTPADTQSSTIDAT